MASRMRQFGLILLVTAAVAACGGGGKKAAPASSSAAPTTSSSSSSSSSSSGAALPDGVVLIKDASSGDPSLFGQNVSVTTTKTGDPVVAFAVHDASGDRSTIFVTAFDSKTKAFGPQVKVATATLHAEAQSLSIARDDPSGTLVLVWDDGDKKIMASQSTDTGATWHTLAVVDGSDPAHSGHSPSIAAAGGKVAIAFIDGNDVPTVATGTLAATTFAVTEVTTGPDGAGPNNAVPAVAASPSGSFGIAYITAPPAGGVAAEFLAVGGAAPVQAMNSNGIQNDSPSVALAFGPNGPIVGATMCTVENEEGACTYATVSNDGGATFGAPVSVPADSGTGPAFVTRLAADGKSAVALAYISNSGNGTAKCGEPKISLSTDLAKTWHTCSPDADGSGQFDSGVPALAVAPDRSLVLAFQQKSTFAKAPTGILVGVIPPNS